jgi:hypothetical protein
LSLDNATRIPFIALMLEEECAAELMMGGEPSLMASINQTASVLTIKSFVNTGECNQRRGQGKE